MAGPNQSGPGPQPGIGTSGYSGASGASGSGGGGITNSAPANTIPVSDGTNLVPANTLASSLPVSTGSLTVTTAEPAPGAPIIGQDGGTNDLSAGDYRYRLVYNTNEGHTQGGTISDPITNDPLTNNPVSVTAPSGGLGSNFVTSVSIYRTAANGSVYKLVQAEVPLSEFPYADNVPDASLGATAPTTNTTANPKLVISPTAANIGRITDDGTTIKLAAPTGSISIGDPNTDASGTTLTVNNSSKSITSQATDLEVTEAYSKRVESAADATTSLYLLDELSNAGDITYNPYYADVIETDLGDSFDAVGGTKIRIVHAAKTITLTADPSTGVINLAAGKMGFYDKSNVTRPEVPAIPTPQNIVDALVALGLITQAS